LATPLTAYIQQLLGELATEATDWYRQREPLLEWLAR
jgi:hypothetical protein